LARIKELIPIITNYFEITEPVLQTKTLMDQLSEKSLRDPMTSLYNRRFFDEYIETNITESSHLSLMMIDIDLFKNVNDTYGHDVGDRVIKEVAQLFKRVLKGSDLAVRFGGEEFVVITFNTDSTIAMKIANEIREEFAKIIFTTSIEKFSKTLSIGIANFPEDSIDSVEVLKYADIALYHAKNTGRNRVVTYDKTMQKEL
jgi:diguanylate cyclase (GGDEF)-like protein